MADPNIPTAEVVEMRDTLEYPPSAGNRYLAVNFGGCLGLVEWKSGDEKVWVCAMKYPKIPEISKKRMMEQYKFEGAAFPIMQGVTHV